MEGADGSRGRAGGGAARRAQRMDAATGAVDGRVAGAGAAREHRGGRGGCAPRGALRAGFQRPGGRALLRTRRGRRRRRVATRRRRFPLRGPPRARRPPPAAARGEWVVTGGGGGEPGSWRTRSRGPTRQWCLTLTRASASSPSRCLRGPPPPPLASPRRLAAPRHSRPHSTTSACASACRATCPPRRPSPAPRSATAWAHWCGGNRGGRSFPAARQFRAHLAWMIETL